MNASQLRHQVVAAVAAFGALVAYADFTVSENLTLTADTDWRSKGTVTIVPGVTVNLNGYKLRVKGLICGGSIVYESGGYRRLSYIDSSYTQLIDTEYKPSATTGVEMDFSTLSASNDNRALFGAKWGGAGGNGYFLYVGGTMSRFYGNGNAFLDLASNKHYRFATLPGESPNVVMYDGETGESLATSDNTLDYSGDNTMTIFGCRPNTQNKAAIRLYSFKITEEGTLKRDMVPAMRESDSAVGLYDYVTKRFFENTGSGVFGMGEAECVLLLDLGDGATYSFEGTCEVPVAVDDSELTQDCDLRTLGSVSIDGRVALNGHTLKVSSLYGSGTIYDQLEYFNSASSTLYLDVPENVTAVNQSVSIEGRIQVVKDGAGTFVPIKANQTYMGGTHVAKGTVRIGANEVGVLGANGSTLSVADGAQLLDPLAANNVVSQLHLQLEGTGPDGAGAYRVTASKGFAYNYGWLASLTLTGDALFGRDDYGFGLVATDYGAVPLKLNGHTLTYRSPKATGQNALHLAISNVQGDGPGTLVISDNVMLYPRETASALPEVTLVIGTNAKYWTGTDSVGQDITVSNLVYRSASTDSQTERTTTVLGSYTLASTASEPKVRLGDAEHLSTVLDLSEQNVPAQRLTFAEGSKVLVKVGARKIHSGDLLVIWSEKPSNVKFVSDRPGGLYASDGGLRFVRGLEIIVR